MGTKYTVKGIFACIGNPGKLPAVIVQEAGSKADSATCCDVGKGCIVVGAVEI